MSERYWVTGVELGLLVATDEVTRKALVDKIIDKQFIGNYHTEENQKNFAKKMKMMKGDQ